MEHDRITIQQASDRLKINRKTIYRWIERGLVSKEKEGNRAYVSMAEVQAQYDREHVKEHDGHTGNVTGNIPGIDIVTLEKNRYEALLIRLGGLEAERRHLLTFQDAIQEKDKLIADQQAEIERLRAEVERARLPWWKKLFKNIK